MQISFYKMLQTEMQQYKKNQTEMINWTIPRFKRIVQHIQTKVIYHINKRKDKNTWSSQ